MLSWEKVKEVSPTGIEENISVTDLIGGVGILTSFVRSLDHSGASSFVYSQALF